MVPNLRLAVQMPLLPVCSNSLTECHGDRKQVHLLSSPALFCLQISESLWMLLPLFWASPHWEQLMQAAMVLHGYAPCLLARVPHCLSLNYHYT